jgi:hypothetical protein
LILISIGIEAPPSAGQSAAGRQEDTRKLAWRRSTRTRSGQVTIEHDHLHWHSLSSRVLKN